MQTKQKLNQKQSYKRQPLLLEMEATLMFQEMIYMYIDAYINFISVTCSPHNAKPAIGRYQCADQPIPIIGKMADTDYGPIIGASLVGSFKICITNFILQPTL